MNQTRNEKIVHTQGLLHRRAWPAWVILVGAIIITILVTLYMKSDVDVQAKREFIFACKDIRGGIDDRLQAHETILLAGAALFDASDKVTSEEWRIFTQRLNVESNFPGIQGIGFALRIPPGRLAQHVEQIRSEGFPDYNVWPEGDRDAYSSVIYLEPFLGRNLRAFGYDMLSEPVRRAAMERARDQNVAALSGKVFLVQETDEDIQAGTLMYVPVYRKGMPTGTVEQRREALFGWVYSPYRMTDLMRGTLGAWDKQEGLRIRLQVYDGTLLSPETILYDSQAAKDIGPAPQFTEELQVIFNGSPWTLRFTQARGQVSLAKVWGPLASGMIISFLLFGLTLSLLNSRSNALRMADRLTAELRESEDRHRSLVEHLPQRIFIKDRNSVYLSSNGNYASDLGITPEQIVGKDDFAFHPPELAQAYRADDQACMTTGMVKDIQESYHVGGQERLIHTIKVPYHDRGGGVIGVLGIFEDITERKRLEEAVMLSEEKFRTVADFTYDWEYWIDPEGSIIYMSPACERITGYTADEFINNSGLIQRIIHQEDRAFVADHVASVDAGPPHQAEFRIVTRSGETLWIGHVCQAVYSADGKWLGRRVSNRDITDLKMAERKLQELNENLEKRVVERSAELLEANQQLLREIQEHADTACSLRDSEKSVNTVIESSPIGIFVIQNEEYTFANPAFIKIFGDYIAGIINIISVTADSSKHCIDSG